MVVVEGELVEKSGEVIIAVEKPKVDLVLKKTILKEQIGWLCRQ